MLRHAPVNIPLTCDQRIELGKKILAINKFIVLSMTHRTIPVPVLVDADKYPRVCILAFDCIVRYAECLYILSDITVPVCPDHIVPGADIDFISDDKVLNCRVCGNFGQLRCDRMNAGRLRRIEHIVLRSYRVCVCGHDRRPRIRVRNRLIAAGVHHLRSGVSACHDTCGILCQIQIAELFSLLRL